MTERCYHLPKPGEQIEWTPQIKRGMVVKVQMHNGFTAEARVLTFPYPSGRGTLIKLRFKEPFRSDPNLQRIFQYSGRIQPVEIRLKDFDVRKPNRTRAVWPKSGKLYLVRDRSPSQKKSSHLPA